MKLVWKLLKQHISTPQLSGFFLANLIGMMIVLLAMQLYNDVVPIFSGEDQFTSANYLVVSKHVRTGLGSGDEMTFTQQDIEELRAQAFCESAGAFTPSRYEVKGSVNVGGTMSVSTEMFFESVPDDFIENADEPWTFDPADGEVPIILPSDYLALYNFGFAQTKQLPKLTPEIISAICIDLRLRGEGGREIWLKGRIIGFGKRFNTILVPQQFMDWSNSLLSSNSGKQPSRLIIKVKNVADDAIPTFLSQHDMEMQDDKADAGRMMFVLKLASGVVLAIGLLISALSFYILMLSIYLLVQKNTDKLQNLRLIGYSPAQVCRPYQLLACSLNVLVMIFALALMFAARHYYLNLLGIMFPDVKGGAVLPTIALGVALLLIVSIINIVAVRRKIDKIPS